MRNNNYFKGMFYWRLKYGSLNRCWFQKSTFLCLPKREQWDWNADTIYFLFGRLCLVDAFFSLHVYLNMMANKQVGVVWQKLFKYLNKLHSQPKYLLIFPKIITPFRWCILCIVAKKNLNLDIALFNIIYCHDILKLILLKCSE